MVVNVPDIQSINWSPKLNDFGEIVENVDDIDQSIRTILLTPKGSDPHRPDFASGIFNYLDYPITEVKPFLIRESTEALLKWEPRIDILGININLLPDDRIEQIEIQITWQVKNSIQEQISIVVI